MSFFKDRAGSFELTSVKNLPNAHVAYPGERWTNRTASGEILPGEPVMPIASGSSPTAVMTMRKAEAADGIDQIALATRVIDIPDPNMGPNSLGPNEVRNQPILSGEWIMAHYSGVFILTLVVPDTYTPGELIGWNPNGTRPTGKAAGKGAWCKNANATVAKGLFEVERWQEVNSTTHEGILTVRFLGRTQN